MKVGQQGTFTDGQRVTIIEVHSNHLVVKSTNGAVFTILHREFKGD